jgi:DNA helicase-2/ATP-dependent DNA helicase PcrA
VPANALAINVFDYMAQALHGLPSYPVDILVAAEGPMLAGNLIALLMEPRGADDELAVRILDGLAAFELGRTEEASGGAIKKATRYRELTAAVRARGVIGLGGRGVGPGVQALLNGLSGIVLTGDPMTDWRAIRALFINSVRTELQTVGREARHMRLLRRGTQIESRMADVWRESGNYRDARALLAAALLEDQFAATTRPQHGVTVMTIHKAKGKEFDEVIVFEGIYQRYLQRPGAEGERAARFNLHVAATRARQAVTIMTPQVAPCAMLP